MYYVTFCLDRRLTISWQNLVTRKSLSSQKLTRAQHLHNTLSPSYSQKNHINTAMNLNPQYYWKRR